MKNDLKEALVTFGLIVVSVLLLNPYGFWMPDMVVMCMLALVMALFAVLATFVLREKSVDERAEQHKSIAGRNAFLAGSAMLIAGIVVQGYSHTIDAWLVITLTVMIMAKMGTHLWSDRNL